MYITCLHSHLFGSVMDLGTVCTSSHLGSACSEFAPLLGQLSLVSRGPDPVPLQHGAVE